MDKENNYKDPFYDPNEKLEADESGLLPHWEQEGKMQFVTFRLGDSLPQEKLEEYREDKRIWQMNHPKPWTEDVENEYYKLFSKKIDKWLDKGYGNCILRKANIADAVEEIIKRHDGEKWEMHGYVIMPNHVHLIMTALKENKLGEVVDILKEESEERIQELLGIKDKVWEAEYFDRIVRNETHYKKIQNYIMRNYLKFTQSARLYYSPRG